MMMQPLVRWMRVVLPRGDLMSVAVGIVVLIEAIYGLCVLQQPGIDPVPFERIRFSFLTACCLAYGVLRATWFHPALHVDYRRWLELTPWSPGRSMPAGPLLLIPQDIVVVLILMAMHHEFTPQLIVFPIACLLGYLLALVAINRLIGEWALAYAVAFGLAAIPMLYPRWEYILAVEIVCYLLTVWAIRRGLRRFPWKLPELLEGRSFKTAAEAIKDRRLGWPYDVLQFDPPQLRVPLSDGICISLLAGWLELSLLLSFDQFQRLPLFFIVGKFICLSPLFVVGNYLENHRSPIGFWGRVFTLRWFIPEFDRVWMMPIIAGALGIIAHVCLPLYWNSLALTGYLLLILVLGPHLERWRLTGKHRLVFGWNPATTLAKDFIEI